MNYKTVQAFKKGFQSGVLMSKWGMHETGGRTCKVGVDLFIFIFFNVSSIIKGIHLSFLQLNSLMCTSCSCYMWMTSRSKHVSSTEGAGISLSHLQETDEKIKNNSTWYIFSFCSSHSRLPPPWTAMFEWFACWCPCCWPVAALLWSVDCWELRMACTPCPSWLQRWELLLRTPDHRHRIWKALGNGYVCSVSWSVFFSFIFWYFLSRGKSYSSPLCQQYCPQSIRLLTRPDLV